MLVGPSGQMSKLLNAPTRALEHDEVLGIIEDFVSAGVRVWQSGADAVELHAARLPALPVPLALHQPPRRRFGGSLEGRAEIVRRIIIGIRERTAPDFHPRPSHRRRVPAHGGHRRRHDARPGRGLQAVRAVGCRRHRRLRRQLRDHELGWGRWASTGWKSVNGKTIAAAVNIRHRLLRGAPPRDDHGPRGQRRCHGGLRAPVLRRSEWATR